MICLQLTKTNKQGIILTMAQQSQTVKDFLANGGTITKIPTGTKSKKVTKLSPKKEWIANWVDEHTSRTIEQEQLVGYWAKSQGLSRKAIERMSIETLHAMRHATRLLQQQHKYRDQLTAQYIQYIKQFISQAPKNKTTPKDNQAIFRLTKAIKVDHAKAKKRKKRTSTL